MGHFFSLVLLFYFLEFLIPIPDLEEKRLEIPVQRLDKPIKRLEIPVQSLDKQIKRLEIPVQNLDKPIKRFEIPDQNLVIECKLPQKQDSLKDDKVIKFKLYEEVKIYRKPDHQGRQGS